MSDEVNQLEDEGKPLKEPKRFPRNSIFRSPTTQELLSEEMLSGSVNVDRIATKYIKDNGFRSIKIDTEEVTETRVMDAETFIQHSELVTE